MSEFLQVNPSKRPTFKQVLSIATCPSEHEQITHVFAMQKQRSDGCQNNENIGSFKISIKSPKSQLDQNKNVSHLKDFKTLLQDQKLFKQNFTGYFGSEQSLKKIRSQPNLNLNCLCQTQTRHNIENGNSDFYKYWKQKANQYQANNFSLLSKNSTLKLQIEKLKLENKNLLKKLDLENGKIQQWAQDNEEKLRKIEELQMMKKMMDEQVLLLTNKLNNESLKLDNNRLRHEKLLEDKNYGLKIIENEKESEQIKTRWSLKEPKNKSMNIFWQDQFQIPQIKENKGNWSNYLKEAQ